MNEVVMKKSIAKSARIPLFILALGVSLGGCGGAGFTPQVQQNKSPAAGSVTIPAKVDLLLLLDNSSATSGIYDSLETKISDFVSKLDQMNLDYHLSVLPLVGATQVTQ